MRCSVSAPLYITTQGFTALAGVGTAFELDLSEAATALIDAPDARVFIFEQALTAVKPTGEVFTNIDQMPEESGAVADMRRAARMFEMERRSMMAELRAEYARLTASAVAVPVTRPPVVPR